MNNWSRRRKRNILLIALFFLVVVIGLPLYFFFQVTPTCFDTKQNGDETGVDCGGSCTLLCGSQSLPLIMKGDPRLLKVSTSTYEAVAYVQNPNATGVIMKAGYTFTLYEASSSVPVKTITGYTYVPKNTDFAIFEGPFDMGDKAPSRVTFAWNNASLVWTKNTDANPVINVADNGVANASTTPRVDARVTTTSLSELSNIYFVSLVFNDTGTIMAASKTYLDTLAPGEVSPIVFFWPSPFTALPASVRIIPVVLPDPSYIK
ncbi:MAG: hypothetical protein JWN50_627 [Parcubacteria group bacterium]|nr:hypothetical protein [Parcubacteria group bacterium]